MGVGDGVASVDVGAGVSAGTGVGAGGGGLDVFITEDFEVTVAADATTGNSATYLTPGPGISGSISDETTTPIGAVSSIKYTAHATTPLANDWFDFGSIALDDKQKGQDVGFTLYADLSGFSTDVEFVVYDVTNGTKLTSSLDVIAGGTSFTRFSTSIFIPAN